MANSIRGWISLFCLFVGSFTVSESRAAVMYPSQAEALSACMTAAEGHFAYSGYPATTVCTFQPEYRQYTCYGLVGAQAMGCMGRDQWYTYPAPAKVSDPVRSDENLGPACCAGDSMAFGDPINAGTGNKFEQRTEFQGEGILPLSFSWTYNSLGSTAIGVPYGDMLGGLRKTNFSRRVTVNSSGDKVYVSRPGGKSVEFSRSGSQWLPTPGERGSLVETGVSPAWVYTDGAGNSDYFDASGRLSFYENRAGGRITIAYDVAERIEAATDANGRKLSFGYDANGRLQALSLPDGGALSFTYTAGGYLKDVVYPDGSSISYAYDEARDQGGLAVPGSLTSVIDESGSLYSTTNYNGSSQAIGTHLGGVELEWATYQPSTAVPGTMASASITTANGSVRTYSFDVRKGRVVPLARQDGCAGCTGTSAGYSFDANGYPDMVIRDNIAEDYDYDATGLLIQHREAAFDYSGRKRTTQIEWDQSLLVPVEKRLYDSSGGLVVKSTWQYNSRGQAVAATSFDPATGNVRTSSTTYCELADVTAGTCPLVGLVTSVDGPRTGVADATSFAYYGSDDAACGASPTTCSHRKGDLWKAIDALGHVTETLKYDGAGRVLSVKDANDVVTDFEYHPRGWLTARKVRGIDPNSEADDQITRIEYYPTGLVKKTTLPDGSYTAYTYDAAHRLTDITDGEGNTIHYTLDNAGNRTKEDTFDSANALTRTLSRVYNQLGQLQVHKDAYNRATTYTYDASGNLDRVTDALSRVTNNDYDPLNRLSRTIQNQGGINATTQFQYDALDNLTAVVDPKGLTTSYTYNGLGDLTQLSSPDTGVTSYTYDSAGNRKTQTDARGVTATYGYDALSRLTSIDYPDSSLNVAYAYDTPAAACTAGETFAAGRLSLMTDGSGSTQYCYDRFGQMVRKVQATAGQSLTVRYAYTPAGQLSSVMYPDGTVADYVRDGQGRTTEVGVTRPGGTREVLLTAAGYYPFGPVAEWVFGNGRVFLRAYNQNYQPGVIVDDAPGGLSLAYEFDAVGNLAKLRTGDLNDPPLRLYGYDGLNRLTSAQDGTTQAFTESYSYDATGNRTGTTIGGAATTYTQALDSHRLLAVGAEARSYDNVGNTTAIGTRGFVYSDANRMSQVTHAGVAAMSYAYNGKGEQVRRANGSTGTTTVYDEAGHWLAEYDDAGVPSQQVIWLDDLPVGLIVGAAAANQPLHYIEADALGTPRAVVDAQRNVAVWAWPLQGEAFGDDAPIEDADGDGTSLAFGLRFPGQRYDTASGLNYNYLRDGYESLTGRYSQSDPIGLEGGYSTYAYVTSNPLKWTDRRGLACDQRGCWNTPEELRAASAGNWNDYYPLACAGGDEYACRAGEVASNSGEGLRGMLSEVTNRKLMISIAQHQPAGCPVDMRMDDILRKMEAIRRGLMEARVAQLRGASPATPRQVDRSDIARFHHRVFEENGAGADAFGGDLWDLFHGSFFTNYNWCPSPACKP